MIRTFVTSCLFAAVVCNSVSAWQTSELSANDKDFAQFAGQSDLSAVQLAQLAGLHASTPKVKNFGRMLGQDHAANLRDLTSVSSKIGAMLPNTLDENQENTLKRLKKMRGIAFDHAFLKAVVNQHETAVVSLKAEADHGSNTSLQAFAKRTLPKFEAHLKLAKQLDSIEY